MEKNKIKFRLQFFGEGGDPNTNNPNPSVEPTTNQPSAEEYQKLKARCDELAKSEKSLKQQIQAKMSDEEKKKLLEDELNSKISNYESRLEDYELKETLLQDGLFTTEECNNIIKNKGNKKELIKSITSLVSAKVEKAKQDAIAEFMKTSNISGKTPGEVDTEIEEIKKMAKKNAIKPTESQFFK